MFDPLPTSDIMHHWDQETMKLGISEDVLMSSAAREAFHVLQICQPPAQKNVLILMGGGNNGGDAVCLASMLKEEGARILIGHAKPLSSCRGASGRFVRFAKRCGLTFSPLLQALKDPDFQPDIIVDGFLGTGFHGSLSPEARKIVQEVNKLRRSAFIFSLDIPSGLSSRTGKPSPDAVQAHATVSFEAAKLGLCLPEATDFTGKLYVRKIGIPAEIRTRFPAPFRLMTNRLLTSLPAFSPSGHKGTAGTVAVIGGSRTRDGDLTGAPHLAALAALRSGSGLVRIITPEVLCLTAKGGVADIMTMPAGSGTQWPEEADESVRAFLQKCSAMVIGPGIGREASAGSFIASVLRIPNRPPAVIDADALHHLPRIGFSLLSPQDILTPHPGEAAFLLNRTAAEVQSDRFSALEELKKLCPSVWVLKGSGTLVGSPEEPISVSPFATPNLAVGGSGDILAGCIAVQLSRYLSLPPHLAACVGVFLHGKAGKELAKRFPRRGNLASEIADMLPLAYGNE
ncbi:MAG: NAD(P)H-hydrate dehydratase [Desulfovibrionaceae bacterium]|nr:NAD(P)H-hydrate dehydratase [Desulfovibrionaceae bacterium]